jgi:hypothetical protein
MADEETYAGTQALIHGLAGSAFERHELAEVGPQEWHCGRPKSGTYCFRVILRPGMVVIYGDVGEGIFRGGEAGDTLAWLRDAVDSPSYLLGKLRPAQREFYAGDTLSYAAELAAEEARGYPELWEEAKRLHRHGELTQHTWGEAVRNHTNDSDAYGAGMGHAGSAMWLAEALRWLVEHLPAGRGGEQVEALPDAPGVGG